MSKKLEAARMRLLGGFRVSVGARLIEDKQWRLKKATSLVKILALAPGHRMHRERVMDLLWPELEASKAANNFRYALHNARRVLEPAPEAAPRFLSLRGEQLVLCPEGELWVDVEAFEEAARMARRSREPMAYQVAIDLYTGDLLPVDLYEEWAEDPRQELRRHYLELLLRLAALYEEREEYEPAIEALRRALRSEPTHEGAHIGLMRLYALLGQRQEALRQYEQLRKAFQRELGTEPPVDSKWLYEEILEGRFLTARLGEGCPKEKPLDLPHRHNLPNALTSFIGREREMVEVKRLLSMTRLLTLTGAGGSGKTRLALEVTKDLVGAYPDGVWLVKLAGLSDSQLVSQEVANVLSVREHPSRPILETLAGSLRERNMLLVLDNCEHLIEAAAHLAETLLKACPHLRILATSREPLGLASEANWRVPPLTVPEAGGLPAGQNLAQYEAVRLFVDRARFRLPTFAMTPQNARAVAEVCQKLEGIPLAVELAAARVAVLSVEQIVRRLDGSIKLLSVGGGQMADPRHQTLRGALDWSYELLDGPERRLFERLSVFAGGSTLEAAETVGAGEGTEEEDVLDLLSELIDKSLVVAEPGEEWDGAMRYRMLEPVRQYAREKLEESGEAEQTKRRHAEWFLMLAEEPEKEPQGPSFQGWLDRLETEHDNLRAALSWSLDMEEAWLGLRLVAALWWFWYARGHLSEGRRWLEGNLSLRGPSAIQARAWALNGAGWISLFQGDLKAAKSFLEEGLALFRKLEDKEGIASTLVNLGLFAVVGQHDDIPLPSLLEEARELRPKLRNRRTVAYLLILEGLVAASQGDLARAIESHEESLALFRKVGDMQGLGGCLTNMGAFELARTEHLPASELLREALRVARKTDDKTIIQLSLFGLANVAAHRGQPIDAARLWGVSEAVREAFDIELSPMACSFTGYENNLSTARSSLGEAAFAAAWSEGKAMRTEQAAEYALSEEEPGPATTTPEQPLADEPREQLTRREEEIAALLAQGLTNRQIAEELTLSERTVDTHVSRILKKLGLQSRKQVADLMTEQHQQGSN